MNKVAMNWELIVVIKDQRMNKLVDPNVYKILKKYLDQRSYI